LLRLVTKLGDLIPDPTATDQQHAGRLGRGLLHEAQVLVREHEPPERGNARIGK
jgi:hypothetical protein